MGPGKSDFPGRMIPPCPTKVLSYASANIATMQTLIESMRGNSEQVRRRRVRGQIARIRRGLYAAPCPPNELTHVWAAALKLDAVVSHETAAALWGIPTLGRAGPIHLTRSRRCQGTARYEGVLVHHARLPDGHITVHNGVRITSPARTVADIARNRQFRAGVVAGDAALRLRRCSRDDFRAVALACSGWPGVARARRVLEFADERAGSPLESISRVAFHDYGLPRPILQATIGGYERADFLWETVRVIGEADGMGKYTSPEVLRSEKVREENFVEMGFTVFRWTWEDAYRRPDALAHRALGILVRSGYRP